MKKILLIDRLRLAIGFECQLRIVVEVESQKDVKSNEFKIDQEIPVYSLDAKVNIKVLIIVNNVSKNAGTIDLQSVSTIPQKDTYILEKCPDKTAALFMYLQDQPKIIGMMKSEVEKSQKQLIIAQENQKQTQKKLDLVLKQLEQASKVSSQPELLKSLHESQSEVLNLKKEQDNKMKIIEVQYEEMVVEFEDIKQQLSQKQQANSLLQSELNKSKEEILSYKSKLQQINDSMNKQEQVIGQRLQTIKTLSEENEKLKGKLKLEETNSLTFQKKIKELTLLKQTLENEKQQILTQAKQEIVKRNEAADSIKDKFKAVLEEKQVESTKLMKELSEKQEQSQKTGSDQEKAYKQLQQRLYQLEQTYSTQKAQWAKMDLEFENKSMQLQAMKNQYAQFEQEIVKQKQRVGDIINKAMEIGGSELVEELTSIL